MLDISQTKNDEPVQPILLNFPKTNSRAFNSKLYTMFNWLEYSINEDSVFCFPCRNFFIGTYQGQVCGNVPYVNIGVKCWINHNPIRALQKHSNSEKHLSSVKKWTIYLNNKNKMSNSVNNLIITGRLKEIEENRKHILFLLKTTLFLAKQGIPFRGHDESQSSINKSNFIELLEMFGDDDLKNRLRLRYGHYCSPEYQNYMVKIIALCTRKRILSKINGFGVFSILVDETKDASKKEQLSFIIRFIDKDFCIHEKTLGCFQMLNSNADSFRFLFFVRKYKKLLLKII